MPARITPHDIRQLMADLDLNQVELARQIGATEASVSRWLAGNRSPQGLYADQIERLMAIAAVKKAGPRQTREDLQRMVRKVLTEIDLLAEAPDLSDDYSRGYNDGYRSALNMLMTALLTKALDQQGPVIPSPRKDSAE